MALDGIILSKIKKDLDDNLPIKINKINDTSKTSLVFNVLANGERINLVISLHSLYNHIALSDKQYSTNYEPSTFTMVLRKHLNNGIIYQIDQNEYDRYLILHITALDDLYDKKEYLLSVELMGKYANLILIDAATNRIIDALKKIPPFENTKRTILQGAQFSLPEKQNKKDPFTKPSIDINESLVSQLQGFSKVLEDEVRYRLTKHSFEEIMNEIKISNSLYINSKNDEYHVIPLKHISDDNKEYSIENGFDHLYYGKEEKEQIKNVTDDIFKFVKRQIKHLNIKIDKLNRNLDDALNLDTDKKYGDLLYTYSDLNRKGLKQVNINDYEDNEITIHLDPKLDIKGNANKYYQSYQKKRKGKSYIEEQIDITNTELEYFNSLSEQLSLANYNDAVEIKEELNKYGYLRKGVNNKTRKKKKINLYQAEFKNQLITFGKNNTQNDYLTFDYAGDYDMWFHAQKYHGSHVIVNTAEPDEETIRQCANLAAYNSNARLSSSVPVDYCLVKNIKKIKGGKLGFVTIKNYKTIYIDPVVPNLDIKNI